jgi:hypothetical protein
MPVYQHPNHFLDSYTSYHRSGEVFFDLVGRNMIASRLLGLFLTAFSNDSILMANLSGRGDKDVSQAADLLLR